MKVLERIAASAEKAAMEKAWSKGLMRCPKCGQKPAQKPVDTETLMRCPACGTDALPGEWRPEANGIRTGHPDRIPAGTRILREGGLPGDCVWHIPASGKFGFFLFFGLLWTAITAAVSGGFLIQALKEGFGSQPWFIYPFFSMFWAVGIGCLYAALRNKYARHRVTVTRDLVTLRREMFGRAKEKSLVTGNVTSVEQKEFYQQNYQPVYGVEIRGHGGKLRFGTTLGEEEKAWLVADIKRAVFGDAGTADTRSVLLPPEAVAAQRQSSFSFPLPAAPKGQWMVGVVFILVGLGGFVFVFLSGRDLPTRGEHGADWISLIFNGVFSLFSLIPLVMGLVFGAIGVQILRSTWPGRGVETRLEGDEIQVALRTYQHGRLLKEQAYPRESVGGVRSSRSGDVSGKPMKRVDLIVDGKAKRVTRWTAGDVADAWVADVTRALGC